MLTRLVIALLFLFFCQDNFAIDDCFETLARCQQCNESIFTSRSFMWIQPVYFNFAIQNSIGWTDLVTEKPCDGWLGSFQVIGMYQQSIAVDKVKKYFLLDKKTSVVIKGDAAFQPTIRDVRAEWLGLPSNFSGVMTIKPEQRQAAVWFEYNQDLKRFFCQRLFQPLWFGAALPVQFVENNINITQSNIVNPGTGPGPVDIITAFDQGLWQFGKFNPNKMSKWGAAELKLKLGATFMNRDGFQIWYNNSFVFPLSGPQDAEFIFSPYLGNNRHFGFGCAVHFQLPLNECVGRDLIAFFFDIENLYLIRTKQHRTFDIFEKQWSRFMLLNKIDGTMNIPAVNVLTQKVKVRPFNVADLSTGFRFRFNNFDMTFGYDLWMHGAEKVSLDCDDFPPIYGIAGTLPGTTASLSTIATRAPNDFTFIPIDQDTLNFYSCVAQQALVHRGHFTLGAVADQECYIVAFGLGAFFELPQENTALGNWGLWAKIGASF